MSDPVILGTPEPFAFEGRTYHASPMTLEMEGMFASHQADAAYREVERARYRLGEAVYRELMQAYSDRLFARAFSWNGTLSRQFLFTPDGLAYAAFLKLKKNESPDAPVDVDLAWRVVRDPEARQRFTDLVVRQDFPPTAPEANGQTPARS
jgi:hypothetical protein